MMKKSENVRTVTDKDGNESTTYTRGWIIWNPDERVKIVAQISAPQSDRIVSQVDDIGTLMAGISRQMDNQGDMFDEAEAAKAKGASKKGAAKNAPAQVDVAAFCDGDSGVLLALQKAGILYVNQVCELGVDVIKKQTGLTRTAAQKVYDNCWKVYGGQKVPGVTSKKTAKPKKEPAKTAVA
jgi:hypothetical protein